MKGENHTIYYDGECVLCNRFVQIILKWDKAAVFSFAPLQKHTDVPELNPENGIMDTIYYCENEIWYSYSDALVRIAKQLPMPYRWLAMFRFIPRKIRDRIYRWVASNRYRWFGKYDACPMPKPEIKNRFKGFDYS